ncbi:hypothetical protein ACIHCQ_14590 [Streptomyces sp. NPDC052236]|uniref:hypothetical protein n=1 Tax=Streptomyces sp. NPDC052236 TaxID=3365686 RepID=UPI0037D05E9C
MSATSATKRTTRASATAVLAACLSLGAPGTATAAGTGPGARGGPSAADLAEAHRAATAPAALESLSQFFARPPAAADPRVEDVGVDAEVEVEVEVEVNLPVYTLAPEFVAGKPGAPVARLEYLAGQAVSSDGRSASVWTARRGADWQVVGIAAGDDEIRYVRQGARKLPGGRVFHEPQIDAWYVSKGERVLPLDDDARRAVGSRGTTLAAYQRRVRTAYAYGGPAAGPAYRGSAVTLASAASGAGALAALALCGMTALRMRRRT